MKEDKMAQALNMRSLNDIHDEEKQDQLDELNPDKLPDLPINAFSTNEEVEKRFKSFDSDIKHWNDYDYILINKNLDICFKQIEQIILNNKSKKFNFFRKAQ